MSAKKKTPAGRTSGLGLTGKNCPQNTDKLTLRQRIRNIIICSCTWGFIPVGVAEWLLRRGGLAND